MTPEEDRRIDQLREGLADDATGPEDAAWIRLALADLLVIRGERDRSVGDIEAAIEYGRTGLAELAPPADGPDLDLAVAFNDLGVGHYLRAELVPASAREDLGLAAEAYRRSIALLPDSDPAVGGVTARLGVALAAAAQRDVIELDEFQAWNQREWGPIEERVTAALETLEAGGQAVSPDDPVGPLIRYWRAMMRAIRYVYFGGGAEDSAAAVTEFEAILDLPECTAAMANACHAYSALLQYYRSMPEAFRRRGRKPSLADFAQVMAAGGVVDPEAARAALAHLDRVVEPDATAPGLGDLVQSIRAMAQIDRTDPSAEAVAQVVEGLAGSEPADPDLRTMRTLLRSAQAIGGGRPEDLDAAAEMFTRTIEDLGDGHPMRDVMQGLLGQLLATGTDEYPGLRPASPQEREAALDLLEQTLREFPDDHPDRASTLTRLLATLLGDIEHRYPRERVSRARTLVLETVERPAADAENEAVNNFLLIVLDGVQSLFGGDDPGQLDDAIERLQRVQTLLPPVHLIRRLSGGYLAMLLIQRYSRAGRLEDLEAADYYARAFAEATQTGEVPEGRSAGAIEHLIATLPAMRGVTGLDASGLEKGTKSVTELVARLPENHPLRGQLERDLHAYEFVRDVFGPDGPDGHALHADPERIAQSAESMVAGARALPRSSPLYPTEMGGAGNAMIGLGFARRDLRTIDEGLAMLADAYDAADILWPLRSWLLGVIGFGLLMRYELGRDRADLGNAIDRLEEARRAGEADPMASITALTLNSLARAYHMRGDTSRGDQRRAGEAGLASLRARAWGVMLQTSTEHAFIAALAAAGEAAEVALWCVADGLTGTAVEALEWGRAMVLHTATTDTGLPALLRKDHPDLAAEWEAASTETGPWDKDVPSMSPLTEARPPSDLRERVMTAIEGTEIERRLFSPAVPEEIAAALRDAGAAALAYLVPGEEGRGGLALVVGADGEARRIPLPRLRMSPNGRADAFVRAQRDRGRADPETSEGRRVHRRWRHALGDLCDWAWTAAMGPLLDTITEAHLPRVVLVPVGELGAIPWHAARRKVANGVVRYACQDAVISYAASARQFIDARRHGHRPWSSAAALVRARGSGLYWASKEIELIHRRYPGGRLLGGRRRSGARRSPPATAGNVLGLLPGSRGGGASLLHLGCHAHSAPRPVDSHLLLADDEVLGMTDILRQARARPPGEPGGLVVLAACGSDLTGDHHDEALTLATAFLAAGAVGVVGTRWRVDDHPSSLFMTMFHHYLNAGYDDPAVALRATQLWMLNPRRSVPPDLADEPGEAPLDEPESWAAFTYQGR